MSTKKKEVEETVTSIPEKAAQPDLPVEEAVQAEHVAEVNEEKAAASEQDEASVSTGQLCRVAFCSRLNLRKNPGMHAPVLQVLPAGTELLIDPLEWTADGTGVWYPVTVDGVNGFVNGQYLAPVEG
jgi:hypothetical protein